MDEAAEQVIREMLVRDRDEARTSIRRGASLIAAVPVLLLGALITLFGIGGIGSVLLFIAAMIYTLVGGIAGAAYVIGGIVEHRHCTRRLRALDEGHQLPQARLLLR